MSIWVVFTKWGEENSENQDYWESEQAIAFVTAPYELLRRHGVFPAFVQEYYQAVFPKAPPFSVKVWLARLMPQLFAHLGPEESPYLDYDGTVAVTPDELMQWATRWRELLDALPPEELAALKLPMRDSDLAYLKQAAEHYQEFACKAKRQQWRIRMSVG